MYYTHKVYFRIAGSMARPPYNGYRNVHAWDETSAIDKARKDIHKTFFDVPIMNIEITNVKRI